MIHASWVEKLDTYLDGELASAEMEELDRHLRTCPECAAESLRRLQWKKAIRSAGQRYSADRALRGQIEAKVSKQNASRLAWWRWPAVAAALAIVLLLAGMITFELRSRRMQNEQIASELVDLHVAALAGTSPVDVVSSDRHTVKPWFEGKIPFTFNLPDLQGTSFELIGGRMTYLQQSPGAELVFRIRKHQVSVFIFRERDIPQSFSSGVANARSFHLNTFESGGLRYFVLGDVAPEDLRALGDLLRNAG